MEIGIEQIALLRVGWIGAQKWMCRVYLNLICIGDRQIEKSMLC